MSARILLVEDDPNVARVVAKMLVLLGHTVLAVAETGEHALQVAARTKPDLVLMDIVLRGSMDGAEAAVQMRQMGVPVVFLTGAADNDTLQRAKQAEPLGYLVKPVGIETMKSAITIALHNACKWLKRSAQAKQGTDPSGQLPPDVALGDLQLAAAVDILWMELVNYYERWNEYNRAVLSAGKHGTESTTEDVIRVLVVLAEGEVKHRLQVVREMLLAAPADATYRTPKAFSRLLNACESYFAQLAKCDEVTRRFQDRTARLTQVEQECTRVSFAREHMREAAATVRLAHALSADAE